MQVGHVRALRPAFLRRCCGGVPWSRFVSWCRPEVARHARRVSREPRGALRDQARYHQRPRCITRRRRRTIRNLAREAHAWRRKLASAAGISPKSLRSNAFADFAAAASARLPRRWNRSLESSEGVASGLGRAMAARRFSTPPDARRQVCLTLRNDKGFFCKPSDTLGTFLSAPDMVWISCRDRSARAY
jgi:hypothetical protein